MIFCHRLTVPAVLSFITLVARANGLKTEFPTGEVHLTGRLTENACTVLTGSREMNINMDWNAVAAALPKRADRNGTSFSVKLADCKPEIAVTTAFFFSGETDPAQPDVFSVLPADTNHPGIPERAKDSGVRLMISDDAERQLLPNIQSATARSVKGGIMELHYVARYRMVSRPVYPGPLRSEVWFEVIYP